MSCVKRAGERVVFVLLVLGLVGCAGFRAARLFHEGTAALNAGQPELAISQLARADQLAPGVSEIQNHLGLAFAVTGQERRALSAFRRAVDLDCSNAAAAHNLAAALALAQGERKANTMIEPVPRGDLQDERQTKAELGRK